MSDVSRRLEQIVRRELSKNVIPVRTEKGILVGDILITNDGPIKFLYRNDELLYKEIHLNSVAIKMANILAFKKSSIFADQLYQIDKDYGKWFTDSQILRAQYQKALSNKDFDRADYLWARYIESRDRTMLYKSQAESLIRIE